MNFELSKEQNIIRKAAADFAKSALEPIAYEDDRTARYPEDVIGKVGSLGYMGLMISKDYGGNGLDMTSMVSLIRSIGKYNASVAGILNNHTIAAAQTIEKFASEELKKNYLPKMASGKLLGGYAYGEVGSALTSGDDKVVAVKDGETYRLTGKKTFVLNGDKADVYVIIGQTDEDSGPKGISAFILEKDEVKESKNIDKLGLKSMPTTEITLEGAQAFIIGEEKDGPSIMADITARMDIGNGALAIGVSDAMLEASIKHSETRIQFGLPISKIQAVQWMLADLASASHLMEMSVLRAANAYDAGGDYILESAYSKIYAMKASREAGMNAVQIHGGAGYSREEKIERYFRDIRGAYHIENSFEYPQKVIVKTLGK